MKVTNRQRRHIKKEVAKGRWGVLTRLSEDMGIRYWTVKYWASEHYRKRVLAQNVKYRKENKEKISERNREYYMAHKKQNNYEKQ